MHSVRFAEWVTADEWIQCLKNFTFTHWKGPLGFSYNTVSVFNAKTHGVHLSCHTHFCLCKDFWNSLNVQYLILHISIHACKPAVFFLLCFCRQIAVYFHLFLSLNVRVACLILPSHENKWKRCSTEALKHLQRVHLKSLNDHFLIWSVEFCSLELG